MDTSGGPTTSGGPQKRKAPDNDSDEEKPLFDIPQVEYSLLGPNSPLSPDLILRYNEQRELIKKEWQRQKKLCKIIAFYMIHINVLGKQNKTKKFKSAQNVNVNSNVAYSDIPFGKLGPQTIRICPLPNDSLTIGTSDVASIASTRKNHFKQQLNYRSNVELDLILDALMDYEIVSDLLDRFKGRLSQLVLTKIFHKINFAIHLGHFAITDVSKNTLIETISNLSVFDIQFTYSKPSVKEAFNYFLLYAAKELNYTVSHIQYLLRIFRHFVYFLDRFEMMEPELAYFYYDLNNIHFNRYNSYYINWFSACHLPKYTKCLRLYKVSDIFGYHFIKDMSKILFKYFRIAFSSIEVKDFIKTFKNEFLKLELPFWNNSYNNRAPLDWILFDVQQILFSSFCEKKTLNNKKVIIYNNFNMKDLKFLLEFHDELFSFVIRQEKGQRNVIQSEEGQSTSKNTIQNYHRCYYCSNYVFCFIHGPSNMTSVLIPKQLLLKIHQIPNDWIKQLLFKIDDNEHVIFSVTTENFDPKKLGVPNYREYFFKDFYNDSEYYRMIINEPLLKKNRSSLKKFLKETKTQSKLYKGIYEVFIEIMNESPEYIDRAKVNKNFKVDSLRPKNLNYNEMLQRFMMDTAISSDINKLNCFQYILHSLIGKPYNYVPEIDWDPPKDSVKFSLLNNLFFTSQNEEYKLFFIGLKNLYKNQISQLKKDYISRILFNPLYMTLMLIKENREVIGGITFRPFQNENFSEIIFCAVSTIEQIKGYGTRMMNHLKDYHLYHQQIFNLLTYADQNAVGFFKKLGFSDDIKLPKEKYEGFIKKYNGAILMECNLNPKISYNAIDQALQTQSTIVDKLIERKQKENERIIKYEFNNGNRIIPLSFLKDNNIKGDIFSIDFQDHSRELSPKFRIILSLMKANTSSWPFLKMEENSDYREIIRFPMNLEIMEEKLNKNYYTNVYMFNAHIKKMFFNCRIYYDLNSPQQQCAGVLERYYINLMKEFELWTEDLN